MKTAKQTVRAYLEANGFDGLGCEHCSCFLPDLMPCGEPGDWCEAGYKIPCPGAEACDQGEDCQWHIGEMKEGKE